MAQPESSVLPTQNAGVHVKTDIGVIDAAPSASVKAGNITAGETRRVDSAETKTGTIKAGKGSSVEAGNVTLR